MTFSGGIERVHWTEWVNIFESYQFLKYFGKRKESTMLLRVSNGFFRSRCLQLLLKIPQYCEK